MLFDDMAIALFAAVGVALASGYVAALAYNSRLYVSSAGKAVLVHLARSFVLSGALVAVASVGTGALMAVSVAFACTHAALVSVAAVRA